MKKLRITSLGGAINLIDLNDLVSFCIKKSIDRLVLNRFQEIEVSTEEDVYPELISFLDEKEIPYFTDGSLYSVQSSYPSLGIFPSKKWLNRSVYNNVLNGFKKGQRLQVGLIDDSQDLMGPMENQLNFLASDQINFWYLYVSLSPEEKPFLWPVLIDSDSITYLVRKIEAKWMENQNIGSEELINSINQKIEYLYRGFKKEPRIAIQKVPYYDGFHNIGGKYWLGITTRKNIFEPTVLSYLVSLCREQKIHHVFLTHWSSIIVKGIKESNMSKWDEFLGLYGITTGHAYYELNWKTYGESDYYQTVKDKVVQLFYKKKVRVWGLSIGLYTQERNISTSIGIKIKPIIGFFNWFVYDLYIAKDFNPNLKEYKQVGQRLSFKELSDHLLQVIKDSSRKLYKNDDALYSAGLPEEAVPLVHQCSQCLTVYDTLKESIKKPAFNELPDSFTCEVCSGKKSMFKEVKLFS